MLNSLSNDRKVILKSALAGLLLFALSVSFFSPTSTFQQLITISGVIATYWCIPTLCSRNRQLKIKEVKCSTLKTPKSKKLKVITYEYFNADGKEVTPCSTNEKFICLAASIIITLILFLYQPFLRMSEYFLDSRSLLVSCSIYSVACASYVVRHSLYFYKNLPIDTSFIDGFVASNPSYSSSSISSKSYSGSSNLSNQLNSPQYSYLSGNIYNNRNY